MRTVPKSQMQFAEGETYLGAPSARKPLRYRTIYLIREMDGERRIYWRDPMGHMGSGVMTEKSFRGWTSTKVTKEDLAEAIWKEREMP